MKQQYSEHFTWKAYVRENLIKYMQKYRGKLVSWKISF